MELLCDLVDTFVDESFFLGFGDIREYLGMLHELVDQLDIRGPRPKVFGGEISELSEIAIHVAWSHVVVVRPFAIRKESVLRLQSSFFVSEILFSFF